jgi:hypothetical protein
MKKIIISALLLLSFSSIAASGIKIVQEKYGRINSIYVTANSTHNLDVLDDSYANLFSACYYGKTQDIKSILVNMAVNSDIIYTDGTVVPTYDEDGYELENNFVNIDILESSIDIVISYNYTDELGVNMELELKSCK